MPIQTPQQTTEASPSELASQQDAALYRHILFILTPSTKAWVPTFDTACDWMEHARRDAPDGFDAVSLAKTCFDESFMALEGLRTVTDGEPRDVWTKFVHRQISRKCRELNPEKFRQKPRKITQIISTYDGDDIDYYLHALCNDGTVWTKRHNHQWRLESPIPQDTVPTAVTAQ